MAVLIASSLRKELSGLASCSTASRSRSSGATVWRSPGRTAQARRRSCARSRARSRWRAASSPGRRARGSRCTTSGRPPASEPAAARVRARRDGRPRGGRGASCASSSARWPPAPTTPPTLRRYSEAQARLEHAGGYDWRDRAASVVRGLGLHRRRPRPAAAHVLGRRADARVARARARVAARPAAARRADEPPRHRVARMARGDAARRSTRR